MSTQDATGEVTAQLIELNIYEFGGVWDAIMIYRNGTEYDLVMVAPSKDKADYDQALNRAGYYSYTWLPARI